ncbi:MAG: hypothetical protein KFF49_09100, partial [Bacteroidales bacterium]|nr:hypothetical protein [Bacteroidales bacterium]
MRNILSVLSVTAVMLLPAGCSAFTSSAALTDSSSAGFSPGVQDVVPGAWSTERYIEILKGKSVGVAANHTSLVTDKHLVDTLLTLGV